MAHLFVHRTNENHPDLQSPGTVARPRGKAMTYGRRLVLAPKIAMLPTILTVVVIYVGCLLWTVFVSFTASQSIPDLTLSGSAQWARLFHDYRWRAAMNNMFVFGAFYVFGCLILGYLLAIFIDQRVRGEDFFRTVFLCPHALSFIVTGELWKWYLDPEFGLQKFVRDLGWSGFTFDWIADRHMAIYTLVIAGIWQSVGVVMVLMLAGLRSVDEDIWKVTRVDGIPPWRVYLQRRAADDAAVDPDQRRSSRDRRSQELRPGHRHDRRRSGHRDRRAVQVRHGVFVRALEHRPCRRGRDDHAAHDHRHRGTSAALAGLATAAARRANRMTAMALARDFPDHAAGPAPRRLSPARMAIYVFLAFSTAFFMLPIYIMVATALKTMPEIRGGSALLWPVAPNLVAWFKAWSTRVRRA